MRIQPAGGIQDKTGQPVFTGAIVRTPGKSMVDGLTTANLGPPDYEKALGQHAEYVGALRECGLEVLILPPDERHPDSTFVEDTALLTRDFAIIMNPGAPSRRGETAGIRDVLGSFFADIGEVVDPGTVEAGDIMMAGSHFFIGLSRRTNENGARQVIGYLKKHGMSGSTVRLEKSLHLKTGAAYLEHNNMAACGEFLSKEEFQGFNILKIDEHEGYAANCIWVNDRILMPMGFLKARKTVQSAGYTVREVDLSEFRKLDGGMSCLSLRF